MTQRFNKIVQLYTPSEECPVCGDLTSDEHGTAVYPADPVFCSSHCKDAFVAEQKQKEDVKAAEVHGVRRVIAAHNAKCSRCATSPVYCFHQSGTAAEGA